MENIEKWQVTFAIVLLIGILFFMVSLLFMLFDKNEEIGESVYFNGSDNVECHTIRIDRNDFLGSYYYKEECKLLEDKTENKKVGEG